ncbi:hypothetical protein KM043_011626 [Ampulex compressa]|nr:hypothetical protein KM043_011626 [Ampulex compressa]
MRGQPPSHPRSPLEAGLVRHISLSGEDGALPWKYARSGYGASFQETFQLPKPKGVDTHQDFLRYPGKDDMRCTFLPGLRYAPSRFAVSLIKLDSMLIKLALVFVIIAQVSRLIVGRVLWIER